MRLVLLGAPGAGKGTQAVLIAKTFSIPHISTGDIFRANIKNGTALGLKAKSFMDQGLLVPDEVTIGIVRDRLAEEDCQNGFVLDGFPRTIPQAEALDTVLEAMNAGLTKVMNIHVDDSLIVSRMSGRRSCPACGLTFHVSNNPPKQEGVCDACGHALIQRPDDQEATVMKRLETYHDQTEPLVHYYSSQGKLATVDGAQGIEATTAAVMKVLGA